MPVTPEDIEAEHKEALSALTYEQHRALGRVQRAIQLAHFNHHRMSENLAQIFRSEAEQRNAAEALRKVDEAAAVAADHPTD